MQQNAESRATSPNSGFTLLELLVSITIFIVVTGSIYALLELGRSDKNRTSRRGDTQKNARIAMYLFGRDVMNAGLGYHKTGALVPDDFLNSRLGVPFDPNAIRDTLTSVAAGNNVFTNRYLPVNQKTDSIMFITRDLDFNAGKAVAVSDEVGTTSNNDVVLQTNAADIANIQNNDLFIAETKTSQIIGIVTSKNATTNRITVRSGDNLGLNQERNKKDASNKFIGSLLRKCTSASDTNCTTYTGTAGGGILLKKIEMVSYQVANDGTLLRTIYGNNSAGTTTDQIQQRAIAYGVQNYQIRYHMLDGSILDDPVVGADGVRGTSDDTPTNMNEVRHLSVSLTVSSTETDEAGTAEIIVLNSTLSLRNMGYDDK
jgi:prepilin-type N-terminal cleavage/methylation domain-containing protein